MLDAANLDLLENLVGDRVKTLPLTPRQQARRGLILECVRSQIEESGYDGVSMRKVAEQANVSPSTLYEIYKSKEHLILYALEENLRGLVVEEGRYEAGLERFVHRLESIAGFFESDVETGLSIIELFLRASANSPANEILLANAIKARKTSLLEMLEMKQLKPDIDVEFYSRALVSLTWGTAIMFARNFISVEAFRSELIRSSLSLLLPVSTENSTKRISKVIDLNTSR